MRRFSLEQILFFILLCLMIFACGPESASEPEIEPELEAAAEHGLAERAEATSEMAREGAADAWNAVQDLYEQAKEAGETVPDDIVEWTRQDVQKIGTWEYRIEHVAADRVEMQATLNQWGKDRWEAYWVERDATGYTLHLKRSARSYLRLIPIGDLLKAIPGAGGDG